MPIDDVPLPTPTRWRIPLVVLAAALVAVGFWLWASTEATTTSDVPTDVQVDPAAGLPSAVTLAMRGALDVRDLLERDPVVTGAMAMWRKGGQGGGR